MEALKLVACLLDLDFRGGIVLLIADQPCDQRSLKCLSEIIASRDFWKYFLMEGNTLHMVMCQGTGVSSKTRLPRIQTTTRPTL